MRQGSACEFRHLQLVTTAIVARSEAGDRWPAWASLLFLLGAGFASWAAIILMASSLAG